MDTDSNRTTPESVDVQITSDLEPVKCSGTYRENTGGFLLEFNIGKDTYAVEHSEACTVFSCQGIQSYRAELKSTVTQMTLDSPFGSLCFDVDTKSRNVSHTADGVCINLVYSLLSDGTVSDRAVEINVKFKEKRVKC